MLRIQLGGTLKPFCHYLAMAMFIMPVIYTTVLIHKKNASYFSCVVYLSIVVNHLGDANPFLFVLDRSIDTLIGIAVGLFVNLFHIHGKLQKNVLFVVDMDNVLDDRNEYKSIKRSCPSLNVTCKR